MPSLPCFASEGRTVNVSMNDSHSAGMGRGFRDALCDGFGLVGGGRDSGIHFEPMRPSGYWISSRMMRLPPQPRIGIQAAIRNRPPGTSEIAGTAEPS